MAKGREDELAREKGTGYKKKKHGAGAAVSWPVGESIFGRMPNVFEVEC
jgi:hypothetical protein